MCRLKMADKYKISENLDLRFNNVEEGVKSLLEGNILARLKEITCLSLSSSSEKFLHEYRGYYLRLDSRGLVYCHTKMRSNQIPSETDEGLVDSPCGMEYTLNYSYLLKIMFDKSGFSFDAEGKMSMG